MPNHVKNYIVADQETIRQIRLVLCNEDGDVDFNRLIRMPAHDPGSFFADGGLSSKDEEANPNGNWYAWSNRCWGTKWNAYAQSAGFEHIGFETAWSMPLPILCALAARCPDATFTWRWADEDIGSNCGSVHVERGAIRYAHLPDPHGFAQRMWDWDGTTSMLESMS